MLRLPSRLRHNSIASSELRSSESVQDIFERGDNFQESNPEEKIVTWQQPSALPNFDNLAGS